MGGEEEEREVSRFLVGEGERLASLVRGVSLSGREGRKSGGRLADLGRRGREVS